MKLAASAGGIASEEAGHFHHGHQSRPVLWLLAALPGPERPGLLAGGLRWVDPGRKEQERVCRSDESGHF